MENVLNSCVHMSSAHVHALKSLHIPKQSDYRSFQKWECILYVIIPVHFSWLQDYQQFNDIVFKEYVNNVLSIM